MNTGHRPQALALAALIAVGLFAGCGGGNDDSPRQSQQGPQLGAPINLADCRDWNRGSLDERLGTIHEIREFLGGSVPGTGGTGAVLEDDQAYDLFEGWCENEFARGFKLYKLYSRAAAFSGQ